MDRTIITKININIISAYALINTEPNNFLISGSVRKNSSSDTKNDSLYDKFQKNKSLNQNEFYEESKAELTGRNLDEDDVKFLQAIEESNRENEEAIKKQTDSALLEFKFRHELLSRGNQNYNFESKKIEPVRSSLAKMNENLKSSAQNASLIEATIKTKRNLLGIAPKVKKS